MCRMCQKCKTKIASLTTLDGLFSLVMCLDIETTWVPICGLHGLLLLTKGLDAVVEDLPDALAGVLGAHMASNV